MTALAADAQAAPPPAVAPLMLDCAAVAGLLKIGRSHLFELVRSGRAPAPIHLGRCCGWRRQELLDWIARGCPPRDRWTWRPKECGP